MKCPTCEKDWQRNSEQAIAVELQGSCIACRIHTLKNSDLKEILDTRAIRLAEYKSNGGMQ